MSAGSTPHTLSGPSVRQTIKQSVAKMLGNERAERLFALWRSARRVFSTYPTRCRLALMRTMFFPDPADRRLNIGGGRWYWPKWQNVDYFVEPWYVDYQVDLRRTEPIGLPSSCASLIFCSHAFEHLADEVVQFVLGDCYRLLRPGGVMRISVPDMDKAREAYLTKNTAFFEKGGVVCVGNTIENKMVNFFASYYMAGLALSPEEIRAKFNQLDKHQFVKWCVGHLDLDAPTLSHINGYDFPKLKAMLEIAGFDRVEKSHYRRSSVPQLRGKAFDNRPIVSMFVEAYK